MTFVYVSGAGTGGKAMWAQVKGRTEAALLELFPAAYMIRLATLQPMHGEVSKTRWTRMSYAVFRPLLPLMHVIAPGLLRGRSVHAGAGIERHSGVDSSRAEGFATV
jgi:hypothetical protein